MSSTLQERRVVLPVMDADPAPRRHSRIAPWRALSLVLINVLIVAHIIQWRLSGRTIGPFVLSDSMHALEVGEVNPGFVFFGVALLVTLLAGRFLCGWACHMGALQDLCAWVLKKLGIRPRLFRARLLGYVPLALALYMFVWPSFRREVLAPLLAAHWPAGLEYIGAVQPFPGFSVNMVTTDMWERLPSIAVAIPFLLICGAATVYFLGSRGLCRYGCPYGGLLRPMERLSPGRIVVEPESCDHCGYCTAACTSGVRVHEEVRAYGRIVDADCIRTLDCISVCPRDALRFGVAVPSLFKGKPVGRKPTRICDLTWVEEFAVLGLFIGLFVIFRGMYGIVPMLMAVGIAICLVPLLCALWRMVTRSHVRFGGLQVKHSGRLTRAGAGLAVAGALALLLVAHCSAVRILEWRGGSYDKRITVSADLVFAGRFEEVPHEARAHAQRALALYTWAGGWQRGGIGLLDTPRIDQRAAWLHLVLGNVAQAEAALRRVERREGLGDSLNTDMARLLLLDGRVDEAYAQLARAVKRQPNLPESRDMLAWILGREGRHADAQALYQRALEHDPRDGLARAVLAQVALNAGRTEEAVKELRRAAADVPTNPRVLAGLAAAEFFSGDVDAAVAALRRAADLNPLDAPAYIMQGAQMLDAAGRTGEAQRWRALANQRQGDGG